MSTTLPAPHPAQALPTASDPLPFFICLAGPTASGKSALALALAALRPVEIISVDSALVYRGMDIGTAKPTPAERASVRHHLIDIREPLQAYSAAEFVQDTRRLITDVHARGRLPLLVGGTMLYFKALLQGLDALPPANTELRQHIEARAARLGWPALHAELARVDPITAARLPSGDRQRIQRALEVWHLTGQPLSSLHTTKKIASDPHPMREQAFFSLEPADRAWLHQRIAHRFDQMLAAHFLDEVAALRQRSGMHPDLPAMRCVGYRQAWETLDGLHPATTLRERGITATRQLAKRQLTWLRSMPQRQVLTVGDETSPDALAHQLLEKLPPATC